MQKLAQLNSYMHLLQVPRIDTCLPIPYLTSKLLNRPEPFCRELVLWDHWLWERGTHMNRAWLGVTRTWPGRLRGRQLRANQA